MYKALLASILLYLLAARFTVDEKTRIRRNLEGFHPLTVTKGKADSEAFFKVIMAFPKPKPRNLDVEQRHGSEAPDALLI